MLFKTKGIHLRYNVQLKGGGAKITAPLTNPLHGIASGCWESLCCPSEKIGVFDLDLLDCFWAVSAHLVPILWKVLTTSSLVLVTVCTNQISYLIFVCYVFIVVDSSVLCSLWTILVHLYKTCSKCDDGKWISKASPFWAVGCCFGPQPWRSRQTR